MKIAHNFNAGPSILPRVAIENAAKAILDFRNLEFSQLSELPNRITIIIDTAFISRIERVSQKSLFMESSRTATILIPL